MKNTSAKKVNIRELQHNLANYLELAKTTPLIITKHGKEEVMIFNPVKYDVKEKVSPTAKLKDSNFIGMYKDRKEWQGIPDHTIATKLRSDSWDGE